MEIDLMKEPWPTIRMFGDDQIGQKKSAKDEDNNSVFPVWEEDYQDLSDWCMDRFQGHCAFPIGEFETSKYSGTKNEDNVVSIKKAGVNGKLSRDLLGVKESLEESSPALPKLGLVGSETSEQGDISQCAIKSENIMAEAIGINDVLLDPIESSINLRTDDWIQLANVKVTNDSPIGTQHKSYNNNNNNGSVIIAEYPRSISFELAKDEKDTWDTINTFDNTGSDTFDLLSYLCDDNIQSPDGSVISRDSGPTIKSNSSIVSHVDETSSTTRELHYTRRNNTARRNYDETNTASIAAISDALDSVAKMSERTSRGQKRENSRSSRKETEDRGVKGRGKKRYIESDSEDVTSECGSYRESREKNNEASRKSRMNKKAKETEMMARASELERDNRILKMKVEELEKLVTSMRTTILRSALKKSC